MTRAEALAAAREHVEKMSTNPRGYQDGVKFPDKVAAVERFARFLMETDATAGVSGEPLAEWERELLSGTVPAGTQFRDKDGDTWTVQADGKARMRPGGHPETLDDIRRDYGPIVRLRADGYPLGPLS